jgi:hypothetical protein
MWRGIERESGGELRAREDAIAEKIPEFANARRGCEG